MLKVSVPFLADGAASWHAENVVAQVRWTVIHAAEAGCMSTMMVIQFPAMDAAVQARDVARVVGQEWAMPTLMMINISQILV
jgi:hypothetical protein